MKMIGSVRRFNTGRWYGKEGQRIVWAVFQRSEPYSQVVVFFDLDRGIEGCIPLYLGNLDLVTNDWVLRAYDDHHWTYNGDAFFAMREALKAEAGK